MSLFFLIIRRPPRSPRPDALFPTLRSSDLHQQQEAEHIRVALEEAAEQADHGGELRAQPLSCRLQRIELLSQPRVVAREKLPDQFFLAGIVAGDGSLGGASGRGDVANGGDRKRVGEGKGGSGRLESGGR